jgi:hypothetical protein
MKQLVNVATTIALIVFLSGCGQSSTSETDVNLTNANKQIQELQAKVGALETKVSMWIC